MLKHPRTAIENRLGAWMWIPNLGRSLEHSINVASFSNLNRLAGHVRSPSISASTARSISTLGSRSLPSPEGV
jgi:hypothetical protein